MAHHLLQWFSKKIVAVLSCAFICVRKACRILSATCYRIDESDINQRHYDFSSEVNFQRYEELFSASFRSYTLTGLSPGVLYLVRMLAGNDVGEGDYSSIYSITTLHARKSDK